MRALTEGTCLSSRYTLIRRVGGGAMADVWLAQDARNDSQVALKILHEKFAADTARHDAFRREWQTASRLMHAHIVRVFDYHDDDERPYFALQYLAGQSISALHGRPLEQILGPAGLIADALRYAHGKGIVHSDLTGANIVLDARGAPYLLDFGAARADGATQSTGGTPVALSPQQQAGEPAHPADDIYAFAVLLNELVCGAPPLAGEPALTDSLGEKLPASLRDLLSRMLAPERAARPDAEAVAEALKTAGFPPGVTPLAATVSNGAPASEEIEVRSVRPRPASQTAAAKGPVTKSGGVPLSAVVVGLGLLLAAFLAVLFVLPPADELPAVQAESEQAVTAGAEESAADKVGDTAEEEVAEFSENTQRNDGSSDAAIKAATDNALGDLLSQLERLRYRGIDRWGGQEFLDVLDRYGAGDEAYLAKNYQAAGDHYRAASTMLEPFFDRIPEVFRETMEAARAAFDAQDHREAIRLFDLAVAITPGNAEAEQGLKRAQNIESVLRLMDSGRAFEKDLEYDAALQAFSGALDIDPQWQPAREALTRVRAALEQLAFESRMTEGFMALASKNYDSARVAFEAAKAMRPDSRQPVDGLLQVDQEVRLLRIQSLESAALEQEEAEQWEAAIDSYQEALSVDGDLQFAKEGLRRATQRAGLHKRLAAYISEPDSLSSPDTMQAATGLLLELSRITPSGPRLEDEKATLARLLKRAATPLPVQLQSDNQTEVSIFRVGRLGTFDSRQLELRPGSYVALGSRAGYRDVRLEFRVAPEIEMKPIIVQCEERI